MPKSFPYPQEICHVHKSRLEGLCATEELAKEQNEEEVRAYRQAKDLVKDSEARFWPNMKFLSDGSNIEDSLEYRVREVKRDYRKILLSDDERAKVLGWLQSSDEALQQSKTRVTAMEDILAEYDMADSTFSKQLCDQMHEQLVDEEDMNRRLRNLASRLRRLLPDLHGDG